FTVKLWDVETQNQIASLEGHTNDVDAVSFSPDGGTLASGSKDFTVKLWDLFTGEKIVAFGHRSEIGSVSLSPNGLTLAAGGRDGKVLLWDVSEWRRPGPFALALKIVSGDGQQGAPGAALPQPLVVEVRDQYGNLLPDAAIVFTVTAGEGKLGGRFAMENVTTDADGQAELTLTLGPYPGPNIVEVSVGGLKRETFHAEGVGTSVTELEGDYRTWLLPDKATVRLGKGTLGDWKQAVAFSPDGRYFAVGSKIGVWLYDMGTSRPLLLLDSGDGAPEWVGFSADGTTLTSVWGSILTSWDLETQERIATVNPVGSFGSGPLSPDGTTLAVLSGGGTLWLWDIENGELSATLDPAGQWIRCVSFSPDGHTLATGGSDGTVMLWDMGTREQTATFKGHDHHAYELAVDAVSFSPDGSTLASVTSGSYGAIRLWDMGTREQIATLAGHKEPVGAVSFSPDGSTLACGSWEGTIRLWDVGTREQTATLKGHKEPAGAFSFSPDGSTLASVGRDGTILLWDVETGNSVGLFGHVQLSSMELSPDGTTLAMAPWQHSVILWNLETQERILLKGFKDKVTSVSFSPDGATLASGGYHDLILWDVATREQIASLEVPFSYERNSVLFFPDGTLLASAEFVDFRGTLTLWNMTTQERIGTLREFENRVSALSFSPDGTLLVSGSYSDGVVLCDAQTQEEVATLSRRNTTGGHKGHVHSISFTYDGTILASGSSDGTVLLWDMQQLQPHPQVLTKVSGDTQQGPAGSALAPFVVSVTDQNGDLFAGATVTFAVTGGGGGLSVETAITNSEGRAASTLTLGSQPGANTVEVTVPNLDPVVFSAVGQAIPQTLTKVSGDEQKGLAEETLADPFVVLVLDKDGRPLSGTTVTFSVAAGGGTLSATTVLSDSSGRAISTLTLGTEPGRNTVAVKAGELKPVIFSATGQPIPGMFTIFGDEQQGTPNTALPDPLFVQVFDQDGNLLEGVEITFAVTAGGGTLSPATVTTDENGQAATTLTLGSDPGANTVEVTVAGLWSVTVTVTAVAAEATPDFDGDGETGFSDFFLFADAFGGSDPRFDLDGSGSVDFADFFLLADYFDDSARGKLLALARELIGLPEGPQLQQNAPNPFNSLTVLSWFQLRPGPARVEVFALTGQRVAVLHQGPKKAGIHRVHWNGRDDSRRPLASGVYLYRLVTDETVQTRKLTLLR
ncbi:MAG: Ig-like domain-containing protein, partial [Gemmatimonadetes bacterium]|nr:Ig-like domain-containing protein [Gemmatimonadota bacterium]